MDRFLKQDLRELARVSRGKGLATKEGIEASVLREGFFKEDIEKLIPKAKSKAQKEALERLAKMTMSRERWNQIEDEIKNIKKDM